MIKNQSHCYIQYFIEIILKNQILFINFKKNLGYTLKLYFIKFIIKTERDGVFPILLQPKSNIEET